MAVAAVLAGWMRYGPGGHGPAHPHDLQGCPRSHVRADRTASRGLVHGAWPESAGTGLLAPEVRHGRFRARQRLSPDACPRGAQGERAQPLVSRGSRNGLGLESSGHRSGPWFSGRPPWGRIVAPRNDTGSRPAASRVPESGSVGQEGSVLGQLPLLASRRPKRRHPRVRDRQLRQFCL